MSVQNSHNLALAIIPRNTDMTGKNLIITEHPAEAHGPRQQRPTEGVERRGADPAPRGHRGGVRRLGRPRPEARSASAATQEEGRQAADGLQRPRPSKRQACGM